MGIYDRDYIRTQRPPGRATGLRFPSLRLWSVTTWLIVINCLVFVVNRFTPLVPAELSGPHYFSNVREVPETQVILTGDDWIVEIPPGTTYHDDGGYAVVPPSTMGRLVFSDHPDRGGGPIGFIVVHPMHTLQYYFHFSTARGFLGIEFWRFIGFQFLHFNLAHILLNMIALFVFGPITEEYLGRKRYLAFYLLAGIFGALLYLLLNLAGLTVEMVVGSEIAIPGLLFDDPRTPLIGASAGVFGVLMSAWYLAPNEILLLFGIFPVRLKWIALFLLLSAVWSLLTGGQNMGGEAGHLGGAIAGWYFIRHTHHLHNFFDFLGYADPTSHHYRDRDGPGRRMRERDRRARQAPRRPPSTAERELDRVLAKMRELGADSLSPQERDVLREATRRRRGG